jgi:hypothetical protein
MGLPRTGSTALSFLLAQDPNVRHVRSWEAAQPCPPPSTVHGADPRIPTGEQPVVAGSRHHVPQDAHGPMECLDLMALDFKSQIFQAYAQIPSYSAWLVDRADFTSTYRYERRVLKLLAWGESVRPWRLKSPAHVLSLDYLDRVFPEAKFVMTHRDPTDVILSVADVYADIVGGFTDHLDRRYLGELNVQQWSIGMDRAVKFRDGGGRTPLLRHRLSRRAGRSDRRGTSPLPLAGRADDRRVRNADARVVGRPRRQREPHPKADAQAFGLDLNAIRPLFADYVQRWRNVHDD